jgi:hypothetical protein
MADWLARCGNRSLTTLLGELETERGDGESEMRGDGTLAGVCWGDGGEAACLMFAQRWAEAWTGLGAGRHTRSYWLLGDAKGLLLLPRFTCY